MHRVILHYTGWSEDEAVSTRVIRAVPVVPRDHARTAVIQARVQGTAILMTATPDVAEEAVTNLRAQGLRVTVEEA